ncbi:phosphotransferase [Microlunatus speluncae]|uniref:phosphotransferase n=1 Tax=Microlunatus speluncae TaxID=2594267 RepID=UPI0013764261|nr:phosphotransferase [Microlunatus speluncae]
MGSDVWVGRVDLTREWTSAEWRAAAEAWIGERLAEAGIVITGPIEQPRVRPWSTQLKVPTDRGPYWFKENNPAMRFEAELVAEIARLAPERVIVPVAVEPGRGWMLGPHGGRTVREAGATDERTFTRILTEYADLQRILGDHRDALLDTGLPELEPADTPDHVDRQVATLAELPADHPLHADAGLKDRAARHRSVIQGAAECLAELPLPSTVQHNDLHQSNTFAAPAGEALRFFDFGDAVWSHPFGSLHVTVVALSREWNCAEDDRRIVRLIDAYLDRWADLAPLPELRRLIGPSMVIGRLHRYNSWHRLLAYLPEEMIEGKVGYLNSLLCGSELTSEWVAHAGPR